MVWCAMSWWTPERILHLIDEFKCRPFLWDVNLPDFKNRPKKRQALQDLADMFSDEHRARSADEIDKKIQNLRVQFRREHRLMTNFGKNTGGAAKRTSWFGYEPLLFLASSYDPCARTLSTMANDAEDVEEDDQSQFDEETYGQEEDRSFLTAAESSGSSGNQKRTFTADKKRRWEGGASGFNHHHSQLNAARDEFTVFGELVANKLRKSSIPKSVTIAQHRINAVLFDLEMEQYETNAASPDVGFYSTGSSFVSAQTDEPCSPSKTPSPTTPLTCVKHEH